MTDFTRIKTHLLIKQLRRHIEGEVRFDTTTRKLYSTDASIYQVMPLGVVIPKTVHDVQTTIQIAVEMQIPITARGGGTSLSGQSIGPGVVIDCSKHLNNILDIDTQSQTARVQPGVVLDQLNRALAAHGLLFGPDVATASRANLGGMIGNNSAGSHSIVYGKTIDHVRKLGVILSDGSRTEFAALPHDDWERRGVANSLEGAIYRSVSAVCRVNAAEIQKRFPRILRRVSGYNLDTFAASAGQANGRLESLPHNVGLHQLIVGSEGTLAFVTEAELQLVRRPRFRGLLVPQFQSLAAAMDALSVCLEQQPSAVELIDQMLLDLARNNLSLRNSMAPITGRPAAVFMVEFSGDDEADVADRVAKLQQRLQNTPGMNEATPVLEVAVREPLWKMRSAAVPLLLGLPGDDKPVTFIEDTAVAPEHLPRFVARFKEVLHAHSTDGAFYGHASVGCLHIRPVLNIKQAKDVARMRAITEDITDLVLEFGGSLSGEHGDGLARSEWNRKMFGDVVYQAFRQVKEAFDPKNLFNPGKVVDAPAMTENLRYGPNYQPAEPATVFDYSKQEGFVRAIELCNGSGECRKLKNATMCPSFRATHDEKDSTRGRANALRLALAGEQPLKDLRSKWVHEVLDLCLMCKACKSECPSNVDMAKLKAEFLNFYYQRRLRPMSHRMMASIHRFNPLASRFALAVNWLQSRRVTRWLLEKFAGIDRRRSLPPLHAHHFRHWFAKHKTPAATRGRVILLDDCFTTFNEPDIGKAAVRVLEAAGYRVELAGLVCCGRPMISKGYLPAVRDLIQAQADELARRVEDGTPILGLEPSCLLTLADEWPELLPNDRTRIIAQRAQLADAWLAERATADGLTLPLRPRPQQCVVHGHCHQKALCGAGGAAAALRLVPQLDVTVLDTGCCGMAGSFGFEKEHFDVSQAIANLDLLPALANAPDSVIAAPGTSCRHQIKDLAQRRALHPLEIIAEQLQPGHAS